MEIARVEQANEGERRDRLIVLFERHASAVSRLAYVLTRDTQAAEDLVQDAFARVGRRLFVIRSDDHARNYLFRTVTNLAKDRSRKLRTERAALLRTGLPEHASVPDVTEQDRMWRALHNLPARQRAALFLRYYQDLSEAETADAMQCSTSAIKSLVNRGLNELRSTLEGETR